ncbi:hypothetical protein GCM10009416_04420 [Craurococcus roseus]|uniref:Uncharacterized protein n=1 Tax=Craurococcus roseus TaxID=77585 RepID=A0ABP3PKF6_9PROT
MPSGAIGRLESEEAIGNICLLAEWDHPVTAESPSAVRYVARTPGGPNLRSDAPVTTERGGLQQA